MSNNNDDDKDILDMVGLNPMGDPEDELLYEENNSEYVIKIKRPRKRAKNDIATMMKFASEVINNLNIDDDECAVTLDFSNVEDFSNVKLSKITRTNEYDDKESDKKNK